MYALSHPLLLDTALRTGIALPSPYPAKPFAHLFAGIPPRALAAGEGLAWEGSPVENVHLVMSGVIRSVRYLRDGRRMITRFIYPGDVVGPADGAMYRSTLEAVTRAQLVALPRARWDHAIAGSPELRDALFAMLRDVADSAQRHAVLLGRQTAEERLAAFLLGIARRVGEGGKGPVQIVLPMGRQDIADHMGLTLETVCRTFTACQRLRLIRVWRRRHMWLLDMDALAGLAGATAPRDGRGASTRTARCI